MSSKHESCHFIHNLLVHESIASFILKWKQGDHTKVGLERVSACVRVFRIAYMFSLWAENFNLKMAHNTSTNVTLASRRMSRKSKCFFFLCFSCSSCNSYSSSLGSNNFIDLQVSLCFVVSWLKNFDLCCSCKLLSEYSVFCNGIDIF